MSARPRLGRILPVALAAALGAGLAGCDTREHANPFDPQNPETGGLPAALEAIAGDRDVELRWDVLGLRDVAGFGLSRWVAGGDTVRPGGDVLAPELRSFHDAGLVNGTTYYYRLDLLAGAESVPRPSLVERATPGPHRPWVAVDDDPPLVRLSADGRRVRDGTGEGGPYADLAVDQEDGSVWAADERSAVLWHFDAAGASILRREGLAALSRLALDEERHFLWALSRSARRLYLLDEAGAPADSFSLPEDGVFRDLDLDPHDGTVWVADGAGALHHAGGQGLLEDVPDLAGGVTPYSVAADPRGEGLWVTDAARGLVHFYRRTPVPGLYQQFALDDVAAPREVASRPAPAGRWQAWVADAAGGLALLDAASGLVARVEGIPSPRGLWAAPDGSCWLIAGGTGAVVRVDAAVEASEELASLTYPRRVALWWRE